jgi:hypothetical protein
VIATELGNQAIWQMREHTPREGWSGLRSLSRPESCDGPGWILADTKNDADKLVREHVSHRRRLSTFIRVLPRLRPTGSHYTYTVTNCQYPVKDELFRWSRSSERRDQRGANDGGRIILRDFRWHEESIPLVSLHDAWLLPDSACRQRMAIT